MTKIATVMGEVELPVDVSRAHIAHVQAQARAIRRDHRSPDKLRRQYARSIGKAALPRLPLDCWVEIDEAARLAVFRHRVPEDDVFNVPRHGRSKAGHLIGKVSLPGHFFSTTTAA